MSNSNFLINLNYQQPENIVIANELEKWHLDGLFNRSIDVLRIPGYLSKENAQHNWHAK